MCPSFFDAPRPLDEHNVALKWRNARHRAVVSAFTIGCLVNTAPTSIKLSAPGGVFVKWSDGHEATYSYAYLRQRCPCATCRDTPPTVKVTPDPFPIHGKDVIKVTGAAPVGHYAIQFNFNDNHATGIYSYVYLREICPCDGCQAKSDS